MINLSIGLRDMLKPIYHQSYQGRPHAAQQMALLKRGYAVDDCCESVLIPTENVLLPVFLAGRLQPGSIFVTARLKRQRNLSPDEIYDQVVAIKEQVNFF
jgi:23S rRNA (adenine2503-C2)-methyltransferase